jgi:hypothetical protein
LSFDRFPFPFVNPNNNTGRKTRLVIVAITSVSDVNQPNASIPPKSLKQKMTNPAVNTSEV